jgi:membrane fusion protein (multidrug efflux system)
MFTLAAAFLLAGLGWGAYWMTVLRFQADTDDAYVAGNLVQLVPQTAGTVTEIAVDDTDLVHQGQVLVRLDGSNARIALQEAEDGLANTVRRVRGMYQNRARLEAAVQARRADLARVRRDLERREGLARARAVSAEDLAHARSAVHVDEAALGQAQRDLAAAEVLVDRTTLPDHPAVRKAEAKVREAWLDVSRTEIRAPVNGYVARRSVQLGQRVSVGAPLLNIVPLDQLWVNANFKESELDRVRIGQPVSLASDFYGSAVRFHGRVDGLGVGTGSAFALLPAQNATGNWIKVVQRLPVRVALDPAQLARHPLRIGLSMRVTIDTHRTGGPVLAPKPRTAPAYVTHVYDRPTPELDTLIARIVADNSGGDRVSER